MCKHLYPHERNELPPEACAELDELEVANQRSERAFAALPVAQSMALRRQIVPEPKPTERRRGAP
jgi:hypothetical protein